MKKFFTSPLTQGLAISNLLSFTIIGLSKYLLPDNGGVLIFSEFVVIPALMGIVSMWFWRNLNLKSSRVSLYSCYNGSIAIFLSYLFLKEGVICLIIGSPLIFCFIVAGAAVGRMMFRHGNDTLNVSIVALLLFIFIADRYAGHSYENEVSDQVVINASPDRIWKNVVSFERIKQKNNFWLFQIGMPSPIESTAKGNYLGAARKCIFSNGYVFDEKISTYQPDKNLTFDVVNQPRDPEIMNHIDIIRGQFILKDNGNGTTTLIGNSWYKLYVFPTWYYDLWAKSITRNVHLRVMEHIKELSEQQR